MAVYAGIGAKRHAHALLNGSGKGALHFGAYVKGLGGDDGREVAGVCARGVSHRFAGDERRHVPGAAFGHELDGLVVHQRAVVDARHAGPHGPLDALGPVGMAGHTQAQIARRFHNGPNFLFRVLRPGAVLAQVEHPAGAGYFDEVGPTLKLFAHGLPTLVRAVGEVDWVASLGDLVLIEAVALVHVPAGGRNGHARRKNAWSWYQTLSHGIAQAGVHARATAVAHGGEAGAQGGQGVALGTEGHVGRVQGELLAELVAA